AARRARLADRRDPGAAVRPSHGADALPGALRRCDRRTHVPRSGRTAVLIGQVGRVATVGGPPDLLAHLRSPTHFDLLAQDERLHAQAERQLAAVVELHERLEDLRVHPLGWFVGPDVLPAEHLTHAHDAAG